MATDDGNDSDDGGDDSRLFDLETVLFPICMKLRKLVHVCIQVLYVMYVWRCARMLYCKILQIGVHTSTYRVKCNVL